MPKKAKRLPRRKNIFAPFFKLRTRVKDLFQSKHYIITEKTLPVRDVGKKRRRFFVIYAYLVRWRVKMRVRFFILYTHACIFNLLLLVIDLFK